METIGVGMTEDVAIKHDSMSLKNVCIYVGKPEMNGWRRNLIENFETGRSLPLLWHPY